MVAITRIQRLALGLVRNCRPSNAFARSSTFVRMLVLENSLYASTSGFSLNPFSFSSSCFIGSTLWSFRYVNYQCAARFVAL